MAMKPLYHVTNAINVPMLHQVGLHPNFSQSKKRKLLVFVVPENKIVWAIAHTMKRHGWELDEIAVLSVSNAANCYQFGKLFYASRYPLRVRYHSDAYEWLS